MVPTCAKLDYLQVAHSEKGECMGATEHIIVPTSMAYTTTAAQVGSPLTVLYTTCLTVNRGMRLSYWEEKRLLTTSISPNRIAKRAGKK